MNLTKERFYHTPTGAFDAGLNQFKMKRSHVHGVKPDELKPFPWFVLRTRAKQEHALLMQLSLAGFDAWIPEVKRFRIRMGKKESIMAVLIPGYVFVRSTAQGLPNLTFVPGSNGLLLQDGKPACLGHLDALRLERICKLETAPELIGHYVPGQKVCIGSGPLKGLSGVVTRTDGRRFLVVESGLNGILLKIDMERNVVE